MRELKVISFHNPKTQLLTTTWVKPTTSNHIYLQKWFTDIYLLLHSASLGLRGDHFLVKYCSLPLVQHRPSPHDVTH